MFLPLFVLFLFSPSLDPSPNFIQPVTLPFTLPTRSLRLHPVLPVPSFLPHVLTHSPAVFSTSLPISFSSSGNFKPLHSSISVLCSTLTFRCNLLLIIPNLQSTELMRDMRKQVLVPQSSGAVFLFPFFFFDCGRL